MSASLVGSEMCIRDRLNGGLEWKRSSALGRPKTASGRAVSLALGERERVRPGVPCRDVLLPGDREHRGCRSVPGSTQHRRDGVNNLRCGVAGIGDPSRVGDVDPQLLARCAGPSRIG
eukprot:11361088-Alexandrium_andersonii.AAC.1